MREPKNSQVSDRLIMAEEVIAEYVQKFGFTVAAKCYFLSWNDEENQSDTLGADVLPPDTVGGQRPTLDK